jgi:hypothetical protein
LIAETLDGCPKDLGRYVDDEITDRDRIILIIFRWACKLQYCGKKLLMNQYFIACQNPIEEKAKKIRPKRIILRHLFGKYLSSRL